MIILLHCESCRGGRVTQNKRWQGTFRQGERHLRAKNCFWICPGMLVVGQHQRGAPCPSLTPLVGFFSSFSAAGHFPLLEAARSCSPGPWPPVSAAVLCWTLLLRIVLNLNSMPQDKKKPTQTNPQKKPPAMVQLFSICLSEQGKQHFGERRKF